jgi:hypothetical protein
METDTSKDDSEVRQQCGICAHCAGNPELCGCLEVGRLRDEAATFWSGAQVLAMSAEIDWLRAHALDEARAEMIEGVRALEGVIYDQSKDVERLRVENARLKSTLKGLELNELAREDIFKELEAKLARVEALLFTSAFGRSKPEPLHEHASIGAKALRAALK